MAVTTAEVTPARTFGDAAKPADPAPLGLAAFALTTFVLSGHNATFIPDLIWIGLALFYGGLCQLLARMWGFKNQNLFGAPGVSTYGGFWMSLGIVVVLAVVSKSFGAELEGSNLPNAIAWFLLAFAIFNTYMLLWSTQVSVAFFLVSLPGEARALLLVIGNLAGGTGTAKSEWTP